jgi:hypothetical protein
MAADGIPCHWPPFHQPRPSSGITIRVDRFVSFVEEVARNDGAHIVGERHIAAALASSHTETLRQLSLDAHVVFARTQEVELGLSCTASYLRSLARPDRYQYRD